MRTPGRRERLRSRLRDSHVCLELRLLPRALARRRAAAPGRASRREAAGRRSQPHAAAEAAPGGAVRRHRHRTDRRSCAASRGRATRSASARSRRTRSWRRRRICATAAPALAEAAAMVGDPAVRNRGTIGGNVAHADPASDLPTVLVALDARMVAAGPSGERTIPAGEFFTGIMTTALAEDEILTAIQVPASARAGLGVREVLASGVALRRPRRGGVRHGRERHVQRGARCARRPAAERAARGGGRKRADRQGRSTDEAIAAAAAQVARGSRRRCERGHLRVGGIPRARWRRCYVKRARRRRGGARRCADSVSRRRNAGRPSCGFRLQAEGC